MMMGYSMNETWPTQAAGRFGITEHLLASTRKGHLRDPQARRNERISLFRTEALRYSLRTCELFKELTDDEVREIAGEVVLRTVEKSAYLFREGDAPAGIYVVRRGIINAHRVSSDGREQVIRLFRAGESLGESCVSGDDGYPADARAVVKSEIMIVPRAFVLSKIKSNPEFALKLIAAMNRHLQELIGALESMKLNDGETRLMHWLLERCPDSSDTTPADIEIGMTKGILASELGTRHETLSRIFARLRDEGHIAVRGRTITVMNPRDFRAAFEANVQMAN